jgi:hypothetical protein
MEVSQEDFEYLTRVIFEGDGQAFNEFTEINTEGNMSVEKVIE